MKKVISITTAAVLTCCLAGVAQGTLLQNGDFDAAISGWSPVKDWRVFGSIPGWIKADGTAGIEVHRGEVLKGITADTALQYIELDSDRYGSPGDTNSAMYQQVNLDPGTYYLDWMYHARTDNVDDNGIKAYLTDVNNELLMDIGSISKKKSEQTDLWEAVAWTFTIGSTTDYRLWFGAYGNDNSRGGFIDSVSLTRNPVPEPATLLLFVGGLAGLASIRRRKK